MAKKPSSIEPKNLQAILEILEDQEETTGNLEPAEDHLETDHHIQRETFEIDHHILEKNSEINQHTQRESSDRKKSFETERIIHRENHMETRPRMWAKNLMVQKENSDPRKSFE